MKAKTSNETLTHFNCSSCKKCETKWSPAKRGWSIGDFPKSKKTIFCPWCGVKLKVENK